MKVVLRARTRIRPAAHLRELEAAMAATALSQVQVALSLSDDDNEWCDDIADCDAVILCGAGLPGHVLGKAQRLRLVHKVGCVLDKVDADACRERGIAVAATSDPSYASVAEHTIMLILGTARNVAEGHAAVLAGDNPRGLEPLATDQNKRYPNWLGLDPHRFRLLGDCTLGLIGFGEIGREVAVRARGIGMKVFYNQRTRLAPALEARLGVEYLPLAELLGCDFVSLHAAHSGPKPLLGAAELDLMGPRCVLVNTARGNQVDQEHLLDLLRQRRLGGAGLDVFTVEPPLAGAFDGVPNLLLSPHTGAVLPLGRRFREVAENLDALASGRPIGHLVAPQAAE